MAPNKLACSSVASEENVLFYAFVHEFIRIILHCITYTKRTTFWLQVEDNMLTQEAHKRLHDHVMEESDQRHSRVEKPNPLIHERTILYFV